VPPEVSTLLAENEHRLLEAETKAYIKLQDGKTVPCQSVPFGRYAETVEVLAERISEQRESLKNWEVALCTIAGILLITVFIIGWRWDHDAYWEVNAETNVVCRVVPAIFTSDRFYYRWGKDSEGNSGWLSCNKAGRVEPGVLAATFTDNSEHSE
jgi:hypothetical protein